MRSIKSVSKSAATLFALAMALAPAAAMAQPASAAGSAPEANGAAPGGFPGGFPGGGRRGGSPAPDVPLTVEKYHDWAQTPPMGWNSWDSFGAGIWEKDALANADYVDANLKSHGWNLITIDIQWYEPLAHTDRYRNGAILETDANGRLLPAPNRFPMTKDTHSFKPIADYLHAKGLKFGLHLMRGIPRQAVDRDNAPILGTSYKASDIVDKVNVCGWNHDMYGVDMAKPGAQEYYDSVFKQMAAWDLDFVKVDDLSGHYAEIDAVRKAIDHSGRPIVFSISPGGSSNNFVATHANMWRISGDFWDNWGSLYRQFALTNAGTPFRGPGHWPDADMIPFGNIRTWDAKTSWTKFTKDEHFTLMTLWSIAKSPLILGGNLPKNDAFTLSMLTNDAVIAVNQHSTNNKQVSDDGKHVVWVADVPDSKDKYVALFNAVPAPPAGGRGGRRGGRRGGPQGAAAGTSATATPAPTPSPTPVQTPDPSATLPADVSVSIADLGLSGAVKVQDLWTGKDLGPMSDKITAKVNSHGAALYRVSPAS